MQTFNTFIMAGMSAFPILKFDYQSNICVRKGVSYHADTFAYESLRDPRTTASGGHRRTTARSQAITNITHIICLAVRGADGPERAGADGMDAPCPSPTDTLAD